MWLPLCFITHWSLIFFFPLIRALSYAYSTFTAIFNSFPSSFSVILAEYFDFFNYAMSTKDFWFELHISAVSYLINFQPPKGTRLMFNQATYKFSAFSKWFTLYAWQKFNFKWICFMHNILFKFALWLANILLLFVLAGLIVEMLFMLLSVT